MPATIEPPADLQDFLQSFVVAILRNKPEDLLEFASTYFTDKLEERNAEDAAAAANAGGLPGMTGGEVQFRPGQDEPSDEESDEGMCEEEEAKMMQRMAMSRRKSVSAEGYDPDDDDDEDEQHVIHGKSDEQRKRLTTVVESMLLFKNIDAEQFNQVIDAMFEKVVEPGENIIKEGDDGDYFYVIESGQYDVLKEIDGEQKKVFQYDNKGNFGELALMYNAPRSATVTSVTPGNLWALDRETFRRIVVKSQAKKRRQYEQFLAKVELLSTLNEEEISKVADAIEPKKYNDGELVISQGDAPDYFYIVCEGKVDIRRRGDDKNNPNDEKHLITLESGKYFGELAFITHKPRAASCYANGPVTCACLDISAFERLLGPCKKLLERNMELYDQQLAAISH
jgi:cAMP-dependent protein kinase regulator